MVQTVEISLRVPSLRVKREGKDTPETISNSDVRFVKRIEVDSIPKAGTVLTMEMAPQGSFETVVVRSDWHEDKNLFVIDGALLPGSAATVNPSLTIAANAERIMETLVKMLR